MKTPSQDDIVNLLNSLYDQVLHGLPTSSSCEVLAESYLQRYIGPQLAAKKMISRQIAKCTTSGFVTSLGGLITLPATIPANVGSVLYVQLRMIAALAYIGGYDIHADEVQTVVYICLANTSIAEICRDAGIKFADKFALVSLKKLPAEILKKINNAVGFRLLTKFGEKGLINLVDLLPVAGALVGGAFDLAETKIIANRAYKTFILDKPDDNISII
ncbi:MAG: EcsC family protein [Oscillospiraceae bacterium]|nr:EcsC family protein [Oscillospiraceae bacterium]